jgi:hypothetical protein
MIYCISSKPDDLGFIFSGEYLQYFGDFFDYDGIIIKKDEECEYRVGNKVC